METSFQVQEASTFSSESSHCCQYNPKTVKIKKNGHNRRVSRVNPHQKAVLIEMFFIHKKKIKEIAQELKINYSTAKTIVYTYRKKNEEYLAKSQTDNNDFLRRCSFKSINNSKKREPISKIICSLAGKATSSQEIDKKEEIHPLQQIFCHFEKNESYVEKFLLIKEIEQRLITQNISYHIEFEGNKAIFWCQFNNDEKFVNVDTHKS